MIRRSSRAASLLSANVFTLTLNAAFALGFALLGPLVINIAGPQAVILVVAGLYFLASIFCWTLPPSPPPARTNGGATAVGETSRAVHSTVDQLREGFGIIRENRSIAWSLLYLGIAASLIGVLGVLGPDFAQTALGLRPKDIAVIVLPLGGDIVMGILLNSYGKFLPRRRVIEGGLVVLGVALALFRSPARSVSSSSASTRPATCSTCRRCVAARGRRVHRVHRRHRLRGGGHPVQTQLEEDLPRMSAGGSSGCSTCSCRFRASCRSSSSARSPDLIGTATVMLVVAIAVISSPGSPASSNRPSTDVAGATADPHAEMRSRRSARIGPRGASRRVPRRLRGRRRPRRRRGPRPAPPMYRPRLTDASGRGRLHQRDDQAWASIPWPVATCRRSMAPPSSCGRRASRSTPTSSRSIAG